MKKKYLFKSLVFVLSVLTLALSFNCSSDESTEKAQAPKPLIDIVGSVFNFGQTDVLSYSESESIEVKGSNLVADLDIAASENYEISLDDSVFTSQVSISKTDAVSGNTTLYIRFAPLESSVGNANGTVSLSSSQADTVVIDLSGVGVSITPVINVSENSLNFEDTMLGQPSEPITYIVNGDNLVSEISLSVTGNFQVSLDNISFVNELQIPVINVNEDTTVYVRFTPDVLGDSSGIITLLNADSDSVEVSLEGNGVPVVHNYTTFDSQRIAFGGGHNQTETAVFNLHNDLTNIEAVKMYVKLRCPSGGCNAWDVFANIKVKDLESGDWYEIGRYITPYGIDNSALVRGFEIDVTDFKSLLQGSTELFARIETWGADGWELTVDFDYIEGTPDYPYYAVSKIVAYDDWSTSGVPYGVDASAFDLTKSVTVPSNSESTHLRTIISGWGHATPVDSDGRSCAEWCYRTHDVVINGSNQFTHDMGPIGCAANLVSSQAGNWQPDRAGWCPGMEVPVRTDQFSSSMAGSTFTYDYDFEDWTSDGGSTSGNGGSYYAISSFVIVKSNTVINKPTVID